MPAPKGNQNALGNSGNAQIDRKKVSTFKGMVLDYVIKVMQGKNEKLKREIVLKSIGHILPRQFEGTPDGDPITFKLIYGNRDCDSLQIPTPTVSGANNEQPSEISSGDNASQRGEDQNNSESSNTKDIPSAGPVFILAPDIPTSQESNMAEPGNDGTLPAGNDSQKE
jgi:hypothetical protein